MTAPQFRLKGWLQDLQPPGSPKERWMLFLGPEYELAVNSAMDPERFLWRVAIEHDTSEYREGPAVRVQWPRKSVEQFFGSLQEAIDWLESRFALEALFLTGPDQ